MEKSLQEHLDKMPEELKKATQEMKIGEILNSMYRIGYADCALAMVKNLQTQIPNLMN